MKSTFAQNGIWNVRNAKLKNNTIKIDAAWIPLKFGRKEVLVVVEVVVDQNEMKKKRKERSTTFSLTKFQLSFCCCQIWFKK